MAKDTGGGEIIIGRASRPKKFFKVLWDNKQLITSTTTTTVASLGAASVISSDFALKLGAILGGIMMVFAVVYTIVTAMEAKDAQLAKDQP